MTTAFKYKPISSTPVRSYEMRIGVFHYGLMPINLSQK